MASEAAQLSSAQLVVPVRPCPCNAGSPACRRPQTVRDTIRPTCLGSRRSTRRDHRQRLRIHRPRIGDGAPLPAAAALAEFAAVALPGVAVTEPEPGQTEGAGQGPQYILWARFADDTKTWWAFLWAQQAGLLRRSSPNSAPFLREKETDR